MHPHGTSIGFGFSLNGAVRLRAEKEDTYLPAEFVEGVSIERLRKADGVQAPILFKIPLLRSALMGFGCATPATKKDMHKLFKNKIDFGILPGGMEEVALYTKGRERVYLKKRAGFIKVFFFFFNIYIYIHTCSTAFRFHVPNTFVLFISISTSLSLSFF
jgi:hypothetical protein